MAKIGKDHIDVAKTGPDARPRLLGVREAATYLGSTVWAIRTLIWEGQIPHIRIGKRLLIDRADLDNFVDQRKISPQSASPLSHRNGSYLSKNKRTFSEAGTSNKYGGNSNGKQKRVTGGGRGARSGLGRKLF